MAAVVEPAAKDRRSSSSSRRANTSHGRGGAGNLAAKGRDLEPIDLETPTLKGEMYTTGRGGSGNMAKYTDPDSARMAQDITAPPRRESTSSHVGRGGAANIFKPSAEEITALKQQQHWENAIADSHDPNHGHSTVHKGFADKGKEWLLKKAGRA